MTTFSINDLGVPEAERIDVFGTRYYKLGDLSGPSVTTVISAHMEDDFSDWRCRLAAGYALDMAAIHDRPALLSEQKEWRRDIVQDAAGEGEREALRHAAVGELFHEVMWTGDIDVDFVSALDPRFQKMFWTVVRGWQEMLDRWHVFPVLAEVKMLMITELGFIVGGTLDALVEDDSGHRSILDAKTGRELKKANALQLAAYGKMLTYNDIHYDDAYLLRLDKYQAGKFDYWPVDVDVSYAKFLKCVDLYNTGDEVWAKHQEF